MNTRFRIINTDVITMLVVKNREHLENRRSILIKERNAIIDNISNYFKKEIEKVVKTYENSPVLTHYKGLLTALNPKVKFKISCSQLESDYFYFIENNSKKEFMEMTFNRLDFYPDFEGSYEQEDKFKSINSDYDSSLELPVKKKVIKYKRNEELVKINKELDEISVLLKNEEKLKEKLIAQVTENAIKNLPEMSQLVENIPLLQLTN